MQKKKLLILVLVFMLAIIVLFPRLDGTGQTANISEVVASPANYLGQLTLINARVGAVDTESSVIVLVDPRGCCEIPLLVPLSVEQQQALGIPVPLYTGFLPEPGQYVETSGTLKEYESTFIYEVDTVKRDGQVIIKKK